MSKRWIALLVALVLALPGLSLAQAPQTESERNFAALMEALMSTEDPQEQISILLAVAEEMPDDVDMLINCAQLLSLLDATGEYAGRCEQMLRRAVRLARAGDQRATAQQALAEHLLGVGRAEEAIALLEEALQRSPDSVQLQYALAFALFHGGSTEEAEALIEEVLEDAPQYLPARRLRADMWLDACQWEQAMQAYRQIEQEWPAYLDGLYGQYTTAIASGQFDLGVRLLDVLISNGAGDSLFLDRAYIRLWKQYQPEAAIEEADALLRMEPAWVDAAAVKIGAQIMMERYAEAHVTAEDVAVVDPLFADLLHGVVLINEGKWREAEETLCDVTARDAGVYLAWRNLSVIRLDGYDDIAGAQEAIGKAFAATGGVGMIDLFTQLGMLRFRQGDLMEAARAFAAADESVYDDPTGLYYLCMVCVDAGLETAMREVMAEMERRYPGWYETLLARTLMEDAFGNAQAALDAYALLVEKFPYAAEMQWRLDAQLRAAVGDETATELFAAWVKERGEDVTVRDWNGYAYVLALLGDVEGAEAALAKAEASLDADGEYPGVLRDERASLATIRAEIALTAGDLEACAAALEEAMDHGWLSLRSLALHPRYAALVESEAYAALLARLAPLPQTWDYTEKPVIPTGDADLEL